MSNLRRVVLVACMVVSAEASAQIVFLPPTSTPSTTVPVALAVGDVDEDGHLDALVADTDPVVGLLLGRGDGTFDPVLLDVLPEAESIVVPAGDLALADVDGDGHLDALLLDRATLRVWRGAGDGSFASPSVESLGTGPHARALALADLTTDGMLDVAALHSDLGQPDVTRTSLLAGDGLGAFTLLQAIASSTAGFDVAVGDLDEDGLPDVAITQAPSFAVSSVRFYRGVGSASWQSVWSDVVMGSSCREGLLLTDLDGDGHRDVLVQDTAFDLIVVRPGHGDGSFGPFVNTSTGNINPRFLDLADLDADGELDAVSGSGIPGRTGLLHRAGPFVFAPQKLLFPYAGFLDDQALGDLDEDGRVDVLESRGGNFSLPHGALEVALCRTYAPGSPFVDLGGQLASATSGEPVLVASGTLEAGDPFGFALSGARPASSAALVLGFAQLGAPFKGGVLVPAPDLVLAGLPVDASGRLEISGTWPATGGGFDLFVQEWVADVDAPAGFSATSGVRASVP
ncbi:MAG: VCBS repeat-containing protein [Planctomycetes bacterium]|nr:VCBS repeat-containing protein [Planctomycetota bacterium]